MLENNSNQYNARVERSADQQFNPHSYVQQFHNLREIKITAFRRRAIPSHLVITSLKSELGMLCRDY